MNQDIRNKLRNVVTKCRKLLEDDIRHVLEGTFSIFAKNGKVTADPNAEMKNLTTEEDRTARRDILDHFAHIKDRGFKPREALDQLVREIAFTHLNRLCAYKMMEAREVYVGGQKFRAAVSRGVNSNGVKFYLAEHEEEERLFNTGQQDVAYRHFLDWLGGQLSEEIGVLFHPNDSANRLYPRQKTLDDVLDLLNEGGLKPDEVELRAEWPQIWSQDETIGWVYQYFTPKELRDQARKESPAPRNSYELAFRNQFFTPRYVVEFLTDNTLGRIWYEMRKGQTRLAQEGDPAQCRYMVRRPTEIFLSEGEQPPEDDTEEAPEGRDDLSQEELLKLPVHIPHRPKKDPRDLKILDPACGSGHFLLYCFDLLLTIYEEAWEAEGASAGEPTVDATTIRVKNEGALRCFVTGEALTVDSALLVVYPYDSTQDRPGRPMIYSPAAAEERRERLSFVKPLQDVDWSRLLDEGWVTQDVLPRLLELERDVFSYQLGEPRPIASPKSEVTGWTLREDYPDLEDLRRDIPRLILAHNLHGIDIDLRASQIAALALWLRCQRAYQELGLKKDRPKITRSNFVCAEPMPGEEQMLEEFVGQLEPKVLGQVVEVVFDKMKLAGEAGSLLKIEEEIRGAVAAAKKQWEAGPLTSQRSLFEKVAPKPVQKRFDLSDVTDDQFFEQAETLVIEALRSYAESAQNGHRLQRRLFADDAVRGFAFVDICQKRYDVVLMNPPFGTPSPAANHYMRKVFSRSYQDLFSAFIDRGCELRTSGGQVGAITSRTGFFLTSFEAWRKWSLLGTSAIQFVCDLGQGVLDTAMVETAAYTIGAPQPRHMTVWYDVRSIADKGSDLLRLVGVPASDERTFIKRTTTFLEMPTAAMSYAADASLSRDFQELDPLNDSVSICRGSNTSDDERFVRLVWEVSPVATRDSVDRRWRWLSKGGEFGAFYSPIHLVLDWREDGGFLGEFMYQMRPRNGHLWGPKSWSHKFMGKPGVVWPLRSQKGVSFRILPADCVISHKSPVVITGDAKQDLALLAILNSLRVQKLAQCLTTFGAYEMGVIGAVPVELSDIDSFSKLGYRGFYSARIAHSVSETDPNHRVLAPRDRSSLRAQIEYVKRQVTDAKAEVLEVLNVINKTYRNSSEEPDERYSNLFMDVHDQVNAAAFLSEYVGMIFGRWDVRFATGERSEPEFPEPFESLPVCPPGMLQGSCGLPATPGDVAEDYPLQLILDGIVVDDSEHASDIVHRLQLALEPIWNDQAASVEVEICQYLGVKELRDYFRRPGKGGFWDDHISRYSKSRRKAPIYWLLQSSKKNYALWLYYHRLDKDFLFKALVNYVEPKIRLETSRLESLTTEKAAAGESGKEAKRLAKEVERQEEFLSELRDFEDKLRRAANLKLDPDLNDGVVLNIAPLHELVPWKEAKKYWNELMAGKYEWSSIGKQLREKGLVK